MREPAQFNGDRERTAYQGRRTPISARNKGISVWSTVGLGLLLALVVLLVANSWRGTPTVAPLRSTLSSNLPAAPIAALVGA